MDDAVLFVLAVAMAGFSAYQIVRKYKNIAFIMLLFWSVLAWRIVAPQPWQIVTLVALLLLQLGLRFAPMWKARVDLAIGKLFLRPLRREERDRRAALSPDDRRTIEVREWLLNKRLTEQEANDAIEGQRKLAIINEQDKAKARQRSLEEALERQKEEAELRSLEVTPVRTPLRVRFHTAHPQDFATTAGTRLVLPAGDHTGELVLRLPESYEPDDAYDVPVEMEFTYIGEGGHRWRYVGALSASRPLDLWRIAKAEPSAEIQFWEDADPAFHQDFQQRCMLAGLGVLDDGRELFPLRIGEKMAIIFTKYCAWKVDLALDEDERRIWVRVSQLNSEVWEGDPFEKNGKTAEWKGKERLPAFIYPVPIEEFLPLTHPERFALSVDEGRKVYWDDDGNFVIFAHEPR